jgi:S1-C subfamily serine protease
VIPLGSSSSLKVGEPVVAIQLQELTLTKKPGDTVDLEYSRDGQSGKATVTPAAQP